MDWNLDHIAWARRLKLRHLEIFLTLASAGSVTAAARLMHMTQPAVSHWLSDIEDLVGTPLFLRNRGLRLTEAGEVLARHARRMLGDLRRTSEEIESVKSGIAGRLHVGTVLSASPVLLPRAIAALQREFPGIYVEVVEGLVTPLIERLQRHELDLIVGPLDVRGHQAGLRMEPLMRDTFSIVTRPGHPLARLRRPGWKEAAAHPWIMPPAGTVSRGRLEEAFAQAGVATPSPRIETASLVALQALLHETGYVSTLASSVAQLYKRLKLVDIVKLPEPLAFGAVGMMWSADAPSRVLAQLQDSLRATAGMQQAAG
ncbi:LysR family transcriptional regulator [Achromobacter sp. Marseille-Q0513]|uniref:LysR family transcriptional regulator n=1 Tax=Achromobacter sp. Marseille-Q0513 TaxID=2829161 RepID=UPI001B93A7A7|nr:LysR substrate-binding domain-containing protein [Achromobacter sp. Marseille-Q0513]MBR8654398.1 LysR family transcriptional regulator [Achromobacter sp. Marseille-Q0513]